jgi:hypothetical protein
MNPYEIHFRIGRVAALLADYLGRNPGCDDRIDAAHAELREHEAAFDAAAKEAQQAMAEPAAQQAPSAPAPSGSGEGAAPAS